MRRCWLDPCPFLLIIMGDTKHDCNAIMDRVLQIREKVSVSVFSSVLTIVTILRSSAAPSTIPIDSAPWTIRSGIVGTFWIVWTLIICIALSASIVTPALFTPTMIPTATLASSFNITWVWFWWFSIWNAQYSLSRFSIGLFFVCQGSENWRSLAFWFDCKGQWRFNRCR